MPPSPGVFPDFQKVAEIFPPCNIDAIAGFCVSICEPSASLIGSTTVFCGPWTSLIAAKNPFEEFQSASCCSSSAFLSHQPFCIAHSFLAV